MAAKSRDHITAGIIVIVILTVAYGVFSWFKPYFWAEWVSGTVTEKIANTETVPRKVLVKIDGGDFVETFINEDITSRMKWNSGDIQGNLKIGEHYKFKVIGRRVHILSSYRNITNYEKDKQEEKKE